MTHWAPEPWIIRGCIPTAHTLTCLRIADVVAHAVARLVTGLRVYALAGRDSHPLDRYSEFQNVTDHVHSFRPALPGRFHCESYFLSQFSENLHFILFAISKKGVQL